MRPVLRVCGWVTGLSLGWSLAGCTAGQQEAVATIVAAMPVLEEKALEAYELELDRCDTVECVERVREDWRPVREVVEAVHVAWCALVDAPECSDADR